MTLTPTAFDVVLEVEKEWDDQRCAREREVVLRTRIPTPLPAAIVHRGKIFVPATHGNGCTVYRDVGEVLDLDLDGEDMKDDARRAIRIGNQLTLETQTLEEMTTDLVRQIDEAREQQEELRKAFKKEAERLNDQLSKERKRIKRIARDVPRCSPNCAPHVALEAIIPTDGFADESK